MKASLPQIERFRADLERCTKCGFCMAVCPVYQEERKEGAVARGKIMLVRALLEGQITAADMKEQLNRCTLCLSCAESCPSGTRVPAVITAARADRLCVTGLSLPSRIVFRWLLPHRRLFGRLLRLASWFQGIFFPRTEGTLRHLPFFLAAFGKGRHIPQIAPRFLRQRLPERNQPPAGVPVKYTVGYFTGCMTEYIFPEIGDKIVRFLNRNGVSVVIPREQGCCGAPAFLGAGDFATGRRLADANVRAFRDLDYIVTDCATCASAMKEYGCFLADNDVRRRNYAAFADKIKDITEFLVDVLKLPPEAFTAAAPFRGRKVTWHDPCHLGRYLGIKEQPRKILKSLKNIQYREMPEAGRCCGMAGTFSLYFYELSRKIATRKVAAIAASGADLVVTGCPGCLIQLTDSLRQHGMPQEVRHIMELLE